jgi:hypothetical protein
VPQRKTVHPFQQKQYVLAILVCTAVSQNALSLHILTGGSEMQSVYETWIGEPVILQVMAGEIRVPLRGTIIKEQADAISFRVGDGWELEIFKSMVLAVEEDNWVMSIT